MPAAPMSAAFWAASCAAALAPLRLHINISSKTADVVLTVTNVRTSEQQAMEEGHGSKTDVGFGFGGGWGGWGGFGGAGISNYQNTAIGQVVVLAYIDAYTKLVGDLGGLVRQCQGGCAGAGRDHGAAGRDARQRQRKGQGAASRWMPA